ncbi:MAG: hypothetical protein LUE98_18455 [Tannerellaceae bacterium]|nr:hypothetical protein [Tannerellaceae bacterium]
MKNFSSTVATNQERCAELLSLAEKRDYDLTPLLHLITMEYHPFTLSERLLGVHFCLSHYLSYQPDESTIETMHNHLYSLQRLYAALRLVEPKSRELFEKV